MSTLITKPGVGLAKLGWIIEEFLNSPLLFFVYPSQVSTLS